MIDPKHPRAQSLKTRESLVHGVTLGVTSMSGLISHGRGEAFDYLLSEKTHTFAKDAITAAAAMLILAKHPVLCTNGNSIILSGREYIVLSTLLNCPIEINLFHRTYARELAMKKYLQKLGATQIVGIGKEATEILPHIASPRKRVSRKGIGTADVVFIPLEDGDRTEAVVSLGKKVITVDLNPLSRTAKMASITIVDNMIRVMPLLIEKVTVLKHVSQQKLEKIIKEYDNTAVLKEAETTIRKGKL